MFMHNLLRELKVILLWAFEPTNLIENHGKSLILVKWSYKLAHLRIKRKRLDLIWSFQEVKTNIR